MGKKEELEIEGYQTIARNLKRGQEGLAIAARKGTYQDMEVVSKESSNILAVQIVYPEMTVRVIVCHGPQEDDESELRTSFFESLAVEIERCKTSEETPIVLGDLNARITGLQNVVAHSANGKLLEELLTRSELVAANFLELTTGKWTRIQGSINGTKKSILDYILMENQLCSLVKEMTIDDERIATPYRITGYKERRKVTYTDHCALIVNLNCAKGAHKCSSEKTKVWNFTDEGYAKYSQITEDPIPLKASKSSDEAYSLWMNEVLSILQKCFVKKTVSTSDKPCKPRGAARKNLRKILLAEAKRGKVQRAVVKQYLGALHVMEATKLGNKQAEKLKKTVALLTDEEKFSPIGYWKLKRSVSRKSPLKLTSVMRPDGIEVTGEDMIKNEFRKEFECRLRNRSPHKEWESYTRNVNETLKIIMKLCETQEIPDFSIEELKNAIKKLKAGKSPGYDGLPAEIFIYAGSGLLQALLLVLNKVKQTKVIPDEWNWVTITTIYKNRGSKKELVNYRGIFLTLIVTKIFENLLKSRMTDQLQKVNLHQAGSRSMRGPPDNLFLLYACIDHHKYKGKPLFITAYDFEQAFDSLWLEDCIMSMVRLGVPTTILELVYKMNKKAKIRVKTPYGMTKMSEIEDIVEQGTVLGPSLCSVSTAEYCETNIGVAVGEAVVSSLIFVDDVFDLNGSTENTVSSHENAVVFGRMKKTPYSKKKCKVMVVNGKKKDVAPSLFIEDVKLQVAQILDYLGDVINEKGDNTSLVEDRRQRGISAMVRIEALIRETELGVHTVNVHLLLYRALFLSCTLFNSQVWRNLSEKDLNVLEKLQGRCLKRILNVPQSTANSFTYLEFGVIPMRYEIEKNQLVFLHHIYHLDDTDPVKIMWENMKILEEESNWWSEVKEKMRKYNIMIEDVKLSRDTFKKKIKAKIHEAALAELNRECKGKKKTADLDYKTLQQQDYLNHLYPTQAKIIFQCRSKTLDIKDHRAYKYKDKMCRKCGDEEETVQHVANCGYDDTVDTSIIEELDCITYDTKLKLVTIAKRIYNFLEEVK